jgi:excisionase family DNA binding protein
MGPSVMQPSDITSRGRPEPLAVSPAEAARLAGIGRTSIYAALGSGALRSLKVGKRRLIEVEALRTWLRTHEVAP